MTKIYLIALLLSSVFVYSCTVINTGSKFRNSVRQGRQVLARYLDRHLCVQERRVGKWTIGAAGREDPQCSHWRGRKSSMGWDSPLWLHRVGSDDSTSHLGIHPGLKLRFGSSLPTRATELWWRGWERSGKELQTHVYACQFQDCWSGYLSQLRLARVARRISEQSFCLWNWGFWSPCFMRLEKPWLIHYSQKSVREQFWLSWPGCSHCKLRRGFFNLSGGRKRAEVYFPTFLPDS